jgi:hypothetical protein
MATAEAIAVEVVEELDLSELDLETRVFVQQKLSELDSLWMQHTLNIVEMGKRLLELKERLEYGQYGKLVATKPYGRTTAHYFTTVAGRFADVQNLNNFDKTALYLLAAPSVPEEAREEAKSLAAVGDRVTHADAQAIVAKHKPQPEKP